MFRHGILASAALGAMGVFAVSAAGEDVSNDGSSYITTPTMAGGGSNAYLGEPGARPVSVVDFRPEDFDDVGSVDLDIARIAGAIGFEVDRRDADLMGRVTLRVVNDPNIGAPPDVRDPDNWLSRTLEASSARAPVSVYDVAESHPGVMPRRGLRLDYMAPIARRVAGDLEVAVVPRANLVVGRDVSGVGGGAVVRFGRNLTKPRDERSRWYAFIGVDAQALTWSLGGGRGDEQALRLEDKQLIGDAQAGIAVRLGAGDLSFGIVHREIKYRGVNGSDSVERQEQYAGVSYSIVR